MDQLPDPAAVLLEDRPVEAQVVPDGKDLGGGGLAACQQACRVMRSDEEHHEDHHADDPQHQQPEQDPADEEGTHRLRP